MEIRNLGGSGLRVSAIGLGCNNFGGRLDLAGTKAVVDRAIDMGITLLDTADAYGGRGKSEDLMGQALGDKRKQIVLATKFGLPMDDAEAKKGASRRYIIEAVEASLKRLRTDYIDLYQQHRLDPLTPIDETLRALDDLVRQGKIRYFGCSNFPGWRVAEAAMTAKAINTHGYVSCQDEYSLLFRSTEKELIPAARHFNMGLLPFFPLASGLLTGKYKRGAEPPAGTRFASTPRLKDRYSTERGLDIVDGLQKYAAERGHTMLELAFSWLLSKAPVASVIAGATKPEQIDQNVKAGDWKMTKEEIAEIDRISAQD